MNRRQFLCTATAASAGLAAAGEVKAMKHRIMTVAGPIEASALGTTLPHEHVMVDFIGAEKTGPDRYDRNDVIRVALPHLQRLKERGGEALVDCSPAYLARDAALLKTLSERSGLHILTNTGYYGAANDQFVPRHAFEESAEALARRWTREWEEGIDGTGIRPGFIKTAVDGAPLSEIDRKLVRAAAMTHRVTGLTIASHTTSSGAIREEREILREEKVDPAAFIWVHAHAANDPALHVSLAREGMWIEFDGLNVGSVAAHADFTTRMRDAGLLHKVLVSHDAGWYHVGEENGGDYRGYGTLFEAFLPALRAKGFTDDDIRQLTVANPATAFTIGPRTA